jgi:hypothetical protein
LSSYYGGTKRFADAIRILKIGVENVPDNVTFLNMLAKLLAMSNDPKLRDGAMAVRLALRASQLTADREPSVLATLAAAYAEAGDFTLAVKTGEKAAQFAQEADSAELAALIRDQLDGYRKNRTYRDPRF